MVPVTRALVAEDDPSARRFFSRLLRLEGFEVEAARNGEEACRMLDAGHNFDIVVSDITMPGKGGIQLLRAVRDVDVDIPVILITGDPSVDTAAKAVELGAERYLMKPVQVSTLRDCIRDASRAHALIKEQKAMATSGNALIAETAQLEEDFSRALDKLWVAYQPIVHYSSRSLKAYEALMRSHDDVLPSPADLLHAAERLDRVHQLGRVIRGAIAVQIPKLPKDRMVFVNLHPSELEDEQLFSPTAPLSRYAHRVVLEITERKDVADVSALEERIGRLRKLGFQVAVDDLGAGYAGLQSFVSLHPEIVKLDMALVRDVHQDPTKERIVRSVAELCRDMSIHLVAEGIETPAERDRIADIGINLHQGYHYAKPGEGFTEVDDSRFGPKSDD